VLGKTISQFACAINERVINEWLCIDRNGVSSRARVRDAGRAGGRCAANDHLGADFNLTLADEMD
jgi:hypothetical protein